MPKFTVDLTPAAVARLQVLTTRYNANNGANLTVAEWLLLHIKEMAIAEDLAAQTNVLRKQAEDNANAALDAALTTERERLLASIGGA